MTSKQPGHESGLDRRRMLMAGGFALAGAAGVSVLGATDAVAAPGDNLVLGTVNDSGPAGSALLSETTDPGLWLSNSAGPDLRLDPDNPTDDWTAAVGDLKGTRSGPLVGVDPDGNGAQTAYLVTSVDLQDFATFLPMIYTVGPHRVLDTRLLPGPDTIVDRSSANALDAAGRVRAREWIDITIAPATGGLDAVAAYLNLTVTGSASGGHAVIYAAGQQMPPTSSVNWAAEATVANFALTEVGSAASQPALRVWVAATTHVIIDITAIYGSLPAGNVAAARMAAKTRALRAPIRITRDQLNR